MKIDQQLVGAILGEIAQLEKAYQFSQGMILSEDDLKCHLFSRISALFTSAVPTLNTGILGSALHAEIKFFDEDNKLTLRPDISIINPDYLSIFHSVEYKVKRDSVKYKDFSSKSFEVGGTAILIELKFTKSKKGINDKNISFYEVDLEKMIRLQQIVRRRSNGRHKIYGIFVIFNKTNKGKVKFDVLNMRYAAAADIHIVYGTGNVEFTGMNPDLSWTDFL
jgi:hypothetical protein